jgi:hypothetical protein
MTKAYIIKDDSIMVFCNGVPLLFGKNHPNFNKVKKGLDSLSEGEITTLHNIKQSIQTFANGKIKLIDGEFYFDKEKVNNSLTKRIIKMMNDEFDVEPMIKFLTNLLTNPSKRAIDELYLFLEQNNLPITSDGYFLAYKKVTSDFKDIYTNSIDNSIGSKPKMKRSFVEDDRETTCSTGLHFASLEYLPNYGTSNKSDYKVIVIKINPRDVVSIPKDYNNAKGRCCQYEVLMEHIGGQTVDTLSKLVVTSEKGNVKSKVKPKRDERGRFIKQS